MPPLLQAMLTQVRLEGMAQYLPILCLILPRVWRPTDSRLNGVPFWGHAAIAVG
jgi:hypothetical protein